MDPEHLMALLGTPQSAARMRLNLSRFMLQKLEASYEDAMGESAIAYAREALELVKSDDGPSSNIVDAIWILVSLLSERYKHHGDIQDVDDCIEIGYEALVLSHDMDDASYITVSCLDLANSLKKRYQHTRDESLISEIVGLDREAFDRCSDGDSDYPLYASALADSLNMRYDQIWDMNLLIEAIELQRKVMISTPLGHPNRSAACHALAKSLAKRYEHAGNLSFVLEAIELQRESLSLRPIGHPEHADSLAYLATSLGMLYAHSGDEKQLIETIHLERQSLALRPKGHADHVYACGNLGHSLWIHYKITGSETLLAEALQLQRESVQLCTKEDSMMVVYEQNLANSLKTSYERTGREVLLDEAISLQREVLHLRPDGHPLRDMAYTNLSVSLWERYISTGDRTLLMEAIQLEQAGLALCESEHPHRGSHCGNLANLLSAFSSDIQLIDEAASLYREALMLAPAGHPRRIGYLMNICVLLRNTYELTNDEELLADSIDFGRTALVLTSPGHPNRAAICGNLAKTLKVLYRLVMDESLLEEIISLCEEALVEDSVSPHHVWTYLCPLSWAYMQIGSSVYDISKSLDYLRRSLAVAPDIPTTAVVDVLDCLNGIWSTDEPNKHSAMVPIYQSLVSILPLLSHAALPVQEQMDALRRGAGVGYDAFVNAAMASNYKVGLESLELAQGWLWSQHLHTRDPQLHDVPEGLASELEKLLRGISMSTVPLVQEPQEASTKGMTALDMRHKRTARAYALIREIRALPGLDRFMLGETYEGLCAVASVNPVVVLVGARSHFYALVMSRSATQDIKCVLLHLDLSDLNLGTSSTISGNRGQRSTNASDDIGTRAFKLRLPPSPWYRQLELLWKRVVKPIIDHLDLQLVEVDARPRLHWCCTGVFTNMPIHAAGIYDGPQAHRVNCSDYVVSSYTPNLTTLLRSQKIAIGLAQKSLSLALVAEKRAYDSSMQAIVGVEEEILQIAAVARSHAITRVQELAGSTTVTGTYEALQEADIVHLACHGVQDALNATESGFCLGDGRLTISKLMNLKNKNAFLTFLSACETAKGDTSHPDQAMHLAAAMLFCGYQNVVATMWAISDSDGPKVAEWFYKDLFAKEVTDANSVARALDVAVRKLRDAGATPERWASFIHVGA